MPIFFYVRKNNKIKKKDNNQNNDDQANIITKYLFAHNQSTESIDVDNNQGIGDNNKSKLDIPEIIDVKTKSINIVEYNNIIYTEVVERGWHTFCKWGYKTYPLTQSALQIML